MRNALTEKEDHMGACASTKSAVPPVEPPAAQNQATSPPSEQNQGSRPDNESGAPINSGTTGTQEMSPAGGNGNGNEPQPAVSGSPAPAAVVAENVAEVPAAPSAGAAGAAGGAEGGREGGGEGGGDEGGEGESVDYLFDVPEDKRNVAGFRRREKRKAWAQRLQEAHLELTNHTSRELDPEIVKKVLNGWLLVRRPSCPRLR
eukprot:3224844-Rhodomonas_salina.1